MAQPRKRAALSLAGLLGVGALLTTASFYDFANLNLGGQSDGSGIGAGAFNIKVVNTDPTTHVPIPGEWQEANTVEGVQIAVPGADTITPGDTISVEVPYLNASDSLGANIKVWMNSTPGKTSDAAYLAALTFTVKDTQSGTVLIQDKKFVDFNELAEGLTLNGGNLAAKQSSSLTLQVKLADLGNDPAQTPNNTDLNGGKAFVQLHFDAESVAP